MAFGRSSKDVLPVGFASRTDEERMSAAKNAVVRFWGTREAPGDFDATVECLKECALSPNELQKLRFELPLSNANTVTGAKVARIDRLLKHLEYMA